jgi:hypothetical protein
MLLKKTNNRLRAYPTHQAVQTTGSTALYVAHFASPNGAMYELKQATVVQNGSSGGGGGGGGGGCFISTTLR